jgi:hypothetical protein
VGSGAIDVIVVYKVDRLTRSLADFAKLVELFDNHTVSFVSVTQQFNTTTSMGRLTLNVLLSFAQFEREVTSERIRDKISASKRKGLWVGGMVAAARQSRVPDSPTVFLLNNHTVEPRLFDSVAGKRNFAGRDKGAETAPEDQGDRCRDMTHASNPANSALLAQSWVSNSVPGRRYLSSSEIVRCIGRCAECCDGRR